MTFTPARIKGLLIGLCILAVLLLGVGGGVYQLTRGLLSPLMALWIGLPMLCLPLALVVLYRLYGLVTARYRLDRNGLYVRWGFAVEEIPLMDIQEIHRGESLQASLRPRRGFWWPGCVVGDRMIEDFGRLEFFAATGAEGLLVLQLPQRSLALSPQDREDFLQALRDSIRLGALEPIERMSVRPEFFSVRLWFDRWARGLIIAGLLLPLALLAFLGFQANRLPAEVPFGFSPAGRPELGVPPTRLLLLPMMVGFWWLVDLILGVWFYRREEHQPVAYIFWGTGLILGLLVWGAVLQILKAV